MDFQSFRPNTIAVHLIISTDDDELDLEFGHNLDDALEDDEKEFYLDVLHGLVEYLNFGMEKLAIDGLKARKLEELDDEADEGSDIVFEADEKLLKLVSDKTVIQFKKKLH